MTHNLLQAQYDEICSYFRTTTEPYDFLEWDGHILSVWNGNSIVETYSFKDLKELVFLPELIKLSRNARRKYAE